MIGSSTSLRAGGGMPAQNPVLKAQPTPAAAPKAPAGYTGKSTIKQPNYIGIDTTEDAANNINAQGWQQADGRYQMKQLDRAGLSRGKGQQFIAGQEGVQAMGQAANQAAELRAKDDSTNSQMRSDYEKAQELEAQNLAMVQHGIAQSDWSRQFARQSAAAQIQMAQQQARMQLMLALMRS